MFKFRSIIIFFSFVIFTAFPAGTAFPNAFDMNAVGVRASAMGSAFTGISNDASAVYFNPGGLTSIENGKWDIDASFLTLFMGFKWVTPQDKEYKNEKKPASLPAVLAASTSGNLAYGIGMYVPFGGGGVIYKNIFGPGADFEAEIIFIAVTASAAYRILPGLSAGIGLSLYYGIVNILTTDSSMGFPVETEANFSGISGYGGNLGLMYKINNDLSAGLTIRNKIPMKMEGSTTMLEKEYDARIEMTMPWYYVVGIAYKILPELLVDFDFWYMTWKDMDRVMITVNDVEMLGGRDIKNINKTYYENSYDAMIGAEYLMNERITLRMGLKYEEQVPEDDKGVSIALNCETDRYTVTLGGGYRITESFEADLSFGYLYGVKNRVDSGTYYQSHKTLTAGIRSIF